LGIPNARVRLVKTAFSIGAQFEKKTFSIQGARRQLLAHCQHQVLEGTGAALALGIPSARVRLVKTAFSIGAQFESTSHPGC